MAKYRLFRRDPVTGHMEVTAQFDCNSDAEAAYLARQNRQDNGVIICGDSLRVVRHFAATLN